MADALGKKGGTQEDIKKALEDAGKHHTQRELDFWNSVVFSCSNGRS
jgi:hypothetical protein